MGVNTTACHLTALTTVENDAVLRNYLMAVLSGEVLIHNRLIFPCGIFFVL